MGSSDSSENGEFEKKKMKEQKRIVQQNKNLQIDMAKLQRLIKKKKRKITELENRLTSKGLNEPPKKKLKRYFCIALTGFKGDNKYCNKDLKRKMIEIIGKLGGRIFRGDLIDDTVTHVVAPQHTRTMKVLQAILKKKWIMGVKWLQESFKENKFIDELGLGFRREENPLEKRAVFLEEHFRKSLKQSTYLHCESLIKYGGGYFIDDPQKSNFILSGNELYNNDEQMGRRKDLMERYDKSYVVSWTELIDIIYPPYLDRLLAI